MAWPTSLLALLIVGRRLCDAPPITPRSRVCWTSCGSRLAAWRTLAEAEGDFAGALAAASRKAELGVPAPATTGVRLALAAQDHREWAGAGPPSGRPRRNRGARDRDVGE